MPMNYEHIAISEQQIPRSLSPVFQHVLDTYASETNKIISVWNEFTDDDLSFRPHEKSSSVLEIMKHQLLSERRFFAEFLGSPEPPAKEVSPSAESIRGFADRMLELALPRLSFLAGRDETWWLKKVPFFDVEREHIWIFWRRVLHTSHHRTQLTVYLRLLEKSVPATYGPTADVTWKGADPTITVEAAERR
ncbi:MAG TPA: DinB family protein [Blastocatellia bacterium]|nr:DinB family protein [Blastocatellia bacterium]